MKVLFFFLLFFFIGCNISFAEYGCYVSGNTGLTGSVVSKGDDNGYWTFTNTSTVYMTCPDPPNSANLKVANSVAVNYSYYWFIFLITDQANCRTSPSGPYTGKVYSFELVPCPIDDYIPVILIVAGAAGFSFLRREILGHFN